MPIIPPRDDTKPLHWSGPPVLGDAPGGIVRGSKRRCSRPRRNFEIPARLGSSDAMRLFRDHGLNLILAEAAVENARGRRFIGQRGSQSFNLRRGGAFLFCARLRDARSSHGVPGISDGASLFDSISGKRGLRQNTANLALEVARKGQSDARRLLIFFEADLSAGCRGATDPFHAEGSAGTLGRLADLIRARYERGSNVGSRSAEYRNRKAVRRSAGRALAAEVSI